MKDLPPPDSLCSVLEAFKVVLKSIDIRTVAVRPEGGLWKNLITAITISEKTVTEVEKDQKKIPIIRNNEFAIFSLASSLDFSLFEKIKEGKILFETTEGNLEVKVEFKDLLTLKASSTGIYHGNFLRATTSALEGDRGKLWDIANNQHREAKRFGYRDIWELFKNTLKIGVSYSEPKDFEVNIPSFAHIEQASFNGKLFEVRIKKPLNLSGLQLNLSLKNRNSQPADILWHETKQVENNEFVFQPYNMIPFDSMEVELIHRDSALVLDSVSVVVPLANAVDPILRTVNGFISLDEVKRMLLEPQNCGEHPDVIFENAIAWLLSIAGFSIIHLGVKVKKVDGKSIQTDRLDLENNYQVGTADIVAYKESDSLYLIDCDLKGNDTKKIHDLVELQTHFQTAFSEYNQLRIVAVLCSPKDLSEINHEGLVRFSNYRINQMFEEVMRGNLEKARSTLHWLV